MIDGGCDASQNFLDEQIGPPGDSYGCCTAVGLPGSADKIGSLTGNEWGDLTFYEANQIPVWVPIFDYTDGTGANAFYHIVGFGAIILTDDNEHAKWLEGAGIARRCARGDGDPGPRLLHRAGWGLHDRRHRRGPPRPLAPRRARPSFGPPRSERTSCLCSGLGRRVPSPPRAVMSIAVRSRGVVLTASYGPRDRIGHVALSAALSHAASHVARRDPPAVPL